MDVKIQNVLVADGDVYKVWTLDMELANCVEWWLILCCWL